jgi:transcriptional regulator with XRE-family HTH domain
MGRRSESARRTKRQAGADQASDQLAANLGRMLLDARTITRKSQAAASADAGITQGMWSKLEHGSGARVTLATWNRAATAVDSSLAAYLRATSAAGQPRDAVHLRHQELILRTAAPGGWSGAAEVQLDANAQASRSGDVLLQRGFEFALIDVWDWFDDVGAALRAWPRRLNAVERIAIARMIGDAPLPRVSGCWVVRATNRNRRLIADHRHLFRASLPGSGQAWLAAFGDRSIPMPTEPALLWVTVAGDRLYAPRLG